MDEKMIDVVRNSAFELHKPNTKYIALCGGRTIGAFDTPDAAFRHIGMYWAREIAEGGSALTMLFTVQMTEHR